MAGLREWARGIKRDLVAVASAARDPRTPRIARILALAIVAYALSPIDLIPDFIPVLGLLDEAILLPLGLLLVIRLIPPDVLAEHRAKADRQQRLPRSRTAALVVVAIWIAAVVLAGWWTATALL